MKNTKKYAFISQPMRGLSDKEILKKRNEVTKLLNEKGYEVIDSFLSGAMYTDNFLRNTVGVKHLPVYYLGKSLEKLSKCDVLYVCKGIEKHSGCGIEVMAAKMYNIPIMYEE